MIDSKAKCFSFIFQFWMINFLRLSVVNLYRHRLVKSSVLSTPQPSLVPCKPDLVRVTDSWQKYTLQYLGNDMIHITLEVYIDPAGDVPAWLYNIVVVDIPLKLLKKVRERSGINY